MKSKKKTPDKKIEYTVAEIKEMILRDSPLIEYGRYNITAPKIVMERLAKETNEPRSTVVTGLVLNFVEENKKERILKNWAKEARLYSDKLDLEIVKNYTHELED